MQYSCVFRMVPDVLNEYISRKRHFPSNKTIVQICQFENVIFFLFVLLLNVKSLCNILMSSHKSTNVCVKLSA